MKKTIYAIATFLVLSLFSLQTYAQGSITTPSLYSSSGSFCAQSNLSIYINQVCYLATGTTISFLIDYGDGSAPVTQTRLFTGTTSSCDSMYVYDSHYYASAGTYTQTVTVSAAGATSVSNSIVFNASNCGMVEGYAYSDANGNCIKDFGESALSGIMVVVNENGNPTNYYATTNSAGYYQISYLRSSSNTYEAEINTCLNSITCAGGNVIPLTSASVSNADYGFSTASTLAIDSVYSTVGNCVNVFSTNLILNGNNMPSTSSVVYTINHGDGNTSTINSAGNGAGICATYDNINFSHSYATAGTFTVSISATAGSVVSNTYTFTLVAGASTCGHYDGYVYEDANLNCTKDAGENTIANEFIYLLDNGSYFLYASSNAVGFYEFNFTYISGHTYTIQRYYNWPATTCASNISFTQTALNASNLDFGLNNTPSFSIQDSLQTNGCGLSKTFTPACLGYFITPGSTYTLNIDFGDGNSNSQTTNTIYYTYGYTSYLQMNPVSHTYAASGVYTIIYTLSGSAGVLATFTNTCTASLCGNYTGNIFEDVNNNCIKDAGELNFQGGNVYIINNGNYVGYGYPDALGNFSADFPFVSGQTYIIEFLPYNWGSSNCYTTTCPSTLTYSSTSQFGTNFDFGVTLNNTNFDLSVNYMNPMATGGFNAGNNYTCYVYFFNNLCGPASGTVEVVLDPNVTFVSSTTSGYTVSGNTVSWPVTNLTINNYNGPIYFTINVPFIKATTSTPFVIGDNVCLTANIIPSATGDMYPANNTLSNCYLIGTAYDPNDKQVSPIGNGSEGIVPQNQALEYVIRFQNTGTATAQTVIVRDTIDANLDMTTLDVIGSSHFMQTSKVGNYVTFTFPNIMLPDSNTNKEASNGFVRFGIKPKIGLPIATKVKNVASIYFDANSAIVTNVVKTQLGVVSGLEDLAKKDVLSVYPNPAKESIAILLNNKAIADAEVKIFNSLGQVVLQQNITKATTSLNISKLPNAVYSIQVAQSNQLQTMKFTKE
jgi:uncharacterized repeat protein (TIGR01451 family)